MNRLRLNRAKACAFAATAAATVALIAGCGGGDDSSANADTELTVTTGSLTKPEFSKRAEAICRERIEEVEAKFAVFVRSNDAGSSDPELAPKAKELIETIYLPAHEREMDRIESLGAPSGDEQEVAAIFEAAQEGLDEAKAHPLTFVQALSKTYEPFGKAERLADAYGVPSCGRG